MSLVSFIIQLNSLKVKRQFSCCANYKMKFALPFFKFHIVSKAFKRIFGGKFYRDIWQT